MTPSLSAVAIVREIYAAVAAGDFEAVLTRLHDDVPVHVAASLPFGGTWRGKAGFQDMAARPCDHLPAVLLRYRRGGGDGATSTADVSTHATLDRWRFGV
ncbi:nuclear transport factor 2 family protein [Gemmatimonas groenlandica]|uniref:Nuclear transport factor 2 family protein n=1 Tax=Gemmatimonas groenlandica TaxID=2732249 RepID=A0A6M4IZ45_9BACT|nr:nuclear transport factor 2 family protein [Gemmatimonas groenlandica]QJR37501.1 nuclear transport factor 2 family protein [Gemmatimonas groenlandica]